MTTKTEKMDFSNVGGAHMLAAMETLRDGKSEEIFENITWIWGKLNTSRLTSLGNVSTLASWSDKETLNHLSTRRQRVGLAIRLFSSQSTIIQKHDLPTITAILEEAHKFANTPGKLDAWMSRTRNPTRAPRTRAKQRSWHGGK